MKQSTLDGVSGKAQTLLADTPAKERRDLEQLLAGVQSRHNEIFGQVRRHWLIKMAPYCLYLEQLVSQVR